MTHVLTHRLAVLVLVAASLGACGYRPVASGSPGDGAGKAGVVVPIAVNQTSFSGIAAPFTAEVRERLAALGVKVAAEGKGAPVLSLVIASIHDETGMTVRRGASLTPGDVAWSVDVVVGLDGADGEQLLPPTRLSGGGRSVAGSTVAAEESAGARTQREIMDELASRIAAMVAMIL
jgi:hypothetical protein